MCVGVVEDLGAPLSVLPLDDFATLTKCEVAEKEVCGEFMQDSTLDARRPESSDFDQCGV